MNFFTEVAEELESGVIGLEITLRSDELQLTDAFRNLVLPFKSQCGSVETAFDLGFLSKVEPPLGLHGGCHGHLIGNKLEQFHATLKRNPKSSPPDSLRKASEQIGGYSGMLKILSALGKQKVKWRASLEAAVLKPKRWPLKLSKRKIPNRIGDFRLEEEEINLTDTKKKTDAFITFLPGGSEYRLKIRSTVEAELNDACFEYVSEQLWNRVSSLFRKK